MANIVSPFCAFNLNEAITHPRREDLKSGGFARLFREELERADTESVGPKGTTASQVQDIESGFEFKPAKTRRLHTCLHANAQEAELGFAQGCARALDQSNRSHDLHPRHRPQFAGALDCAHSRRPCERPAGRALSRCPWHPRFCRCCESQAGSLQVRSQATEGSRSG